MNYTGNNKLRNEIAEISNEFSDMGGKFRLLLDDIFQRSNENDDLVEMIAYQILLDIHTELSQLCRRMAELDSKFLD